MTEGSLSDAAVASRRRLVLALVALVLLLIAVVVATRQSATGKTGRNGAPVPVDNASPSAGASDCEEEPPQTSFTLAECGADEGSEPAAQTP